MRSILNDGTFEQLLLIGEDNVMKKRLERKYAAILQYFDADDLTSNKNINKLIKESLYQFVNCCETPAIWCYGTHTKMLMNDFIYELRGVKLIIDEAYQGEKNSGFLIIGQDQIRENKVDGVIISSFKYRDEIKKELKEKYKDIKYLDIYDILRENGVVLEREYYAANHPYAHYQFINECKIRLKTNISAQEKKKIYFNLLKEYIIIKDFKNAIVLLEEYGNRYDMNPHILNDLQELYDLQQLAVSEISDKNVVMICIDGLRRQDFFSKQMNKINHILEESAYIFRNAYSVSTSTHESLIPAYSENSDLRTNYFEKNIVEEKNCRFIQTAIEQGRKIHFYTDSTPYINSDKVQVTDCAQTVTEKMWDFILDAIDEDNGLFYIHVLYESHYSYPNPYTEKTIIADGTNIMFDFLARKGGSLRTDYVLQHQDAIAYIDDILYPLLSKLRARFVLFADHGNIILPQDAKLSDVLYTQDTFHEDLIQIPLVVKAPEMGISVDGGMISLMCINDIVISLLKKEKYVPEKNNFVKIVRSEIYNPDFQFLYKKNAHEKGLLAFEGFIFSEGYKLIIYSDGTSELYEAVNDKLFNDQGRKLELIDRIRDSITVIHKESVR